MCFYVTSIYHKMNKHYYRITYCNSPFCEKYGKQIDMIQVSNTEVERNSA